jgi:hypothetical protein
MLKDNTIIGIGGYATSGKNLFFTLFNKKIPNSKEFSLAKVLKNELYDYLMSQFGIDVNNCSGAEKEKIRPFLVLHAKIRREESNNRYFTDKLVDSIQDYHLNNPSGVAVITDIRHNSDCDWLKKEMGGLLIHLQRYNPIPRLKSPGYKHDFISPGNETEKKDDPYLIDNADYRVIWPTSCNTETFSDLEIYTEEFIKWLNR